MRIRKYLIILLIFAVEEVVFAKLRIWGARPEFLIVAVIFFGFYFGALQGAEAGALAGLLKDLFSVSSFGMHTVPFVIIGLFSRALRKKIFRESLIAQFVFPVIAVIFFSFIHFIYLSRGIDSVSTWGFWRIALSKSLYTGCAAPFVFILLRKFFERHEKGAE